MNKSFFEDGTSPIRLNFSDYSSSLMQKDYFTALGLSKNPEMIPNIAQGISSLPYESKINQVQMLRDKLKALEMKNKSDGQYLDRYLQSNNQKMKQISEFSSVNHIPTQYSTALESLPPIENNNNNNYLVNSTAKARNSLRQYQLQSYDPSLLNDDNGNRLVHNPKINPQAISQLQGDLFKTRDNISRMKNNLSNIKSIMFSKMEEMEEKQNVALEKLRNVIMIAKKNEERGIPLGISNRNQSIPNRKSIMPRSNMNKYSSINNSNYQNNRDNKRYSNRNNSIKQSSFNIDEPGFFSKISQIIDQKLIDHDRKMQRSQSQINNLPPVRKKNHVRKT